MSPGLTHDERGYPCATSPTVHEELVKRLVAKVETARDIYYFLRHYQPGSKESLHLLRCTGPGSPAGAP